MIRLSVLCLAACVSVPAIPPAVRPVGPLQLSTVVEVDDLCLEGDPFAVEADFSMQGARGSGVIVDARHVLTAAHVVSVNVGSTWRPCAWSDVVHVRREDGTMWRAVIDKYDVRSDLALLELASADSFGPVAPPVVGPVVVDTVVCHANAHPAWSVDCGEMVTRYSTPSGDVLMTAQVAHGNSGGPVYDGEGRLVGITTGLATNGTGGFFTSLDRHRGVWP